MLMVPNRKGSFGDCLHGQLAILASGRMVTDALSAMQVVIYIAQQ